jgi:hypothetical protein
MFFSPFVIVVVVVVVGRGSGRGSPSFRPQSHSPPPSSSEEVCVRGITVFYVGCRWHATVMGLTLHGIKVWAVNNLWLRVEPSIGNEVFLECLSVLVFLHEQHAQYLAGVLVNVMVLQQRGAHISSS